MLHSFASTANFPTSQVVHLVEPVFFAIDPFSQLMHDARPTRGICVTLLLNFPSGQRTHANSKRYSPSMQYIVGKGVGLGVGDDMLFS